MPKEKKVYEPGSPGWLVNHCVAIATGFNRLRETPFTRCETYFQTEGVKDISHQEFVRQVFYGMERYTELIKLVVTGLYGIISCFS
jgi:hypothetical protein